MNRVTLIGNLTRDPSIRTLQSGTRVASFNLAVNRPGKDAGADFIWIKSWNGVADAVMRFLQTGDQVAVDGAINTSRKENEDGTFTNYFEVNARNVQFLRTKGRDAASEDAPPAEAIEASTEAPSEDDIPF